jgi:hypothetical protein
MGAVMAIRTEGQADMTKPVVAFCNLAKVPKNAKRMIENMREKYL